MNEYLLILIFLGESQRLKIEKNSQRRFYSHQYIWRKHENICRLIILIKLIYALIFLCFTISTCLNQSIDNNNECSKPIFIRMWDIWYSFLCLTLILSLFIDRLKRQNIIPLGIINALQISLIIIFIIFVILGHSQVYYRLWWLSSSSIELTRSTLFSIVFIDICPISIAIFITINSLKKTSTMASCSCKYDHFKCLVRL